MIRSLIVWLLTVPFSKPTEKRFEASIEAPAAQGEQFETWQDSLRVIQNL